MTTQTDADPLSAKELARTAWSAIVKEMGNGPFGFEAEEIIAAAIRQYHAARAALSPAQPAQGADIARELAGSLGECRPLLEFAPERFYPRIERADAVLAKARSAGLLTTETEAGNGP